MTRSQDIIESCISSITCAFCENQPEEDLQGRFARMASGLKLQVIHIAGPESGVFYFPQYPTHLVFCDPHAGFPVLADRRAFLFLAFPLDALFCLVGYTPFSCFTQLVNLR